MKEARIRGGNYSIKFNIGSYLLCVSGAWLRMGVMVRMEEEEMLQEGRISTTISGKKVFIVSFNTNIPVIMGGYVC